MDPYRNSVWTDVFGTVLVGAVLLGGAGYLLYHVQDAAPGPALEASRAPSAGPEARGAQPRPRRGEARRSNGGLVQGDGGGVLSSRRSGAPSGAEAPFSDGWQSQATPDLTGPTGSGGVGSSGVPSGGRAIGGAPESEGPTIASRRPQGGVASHSARAGSEGPAWRGEARALSGRARALSRQLGQMERAGSKQKAPSSGEAQSSREASTAKTSGGRGEASASSGPGTPPDPEEQVPIGGLGWLAAAGAAYGIRRLYD